MYKFDRIDVFLTKHGHERREFLTRALRVLVGVGLSLDPEGRKGRLVRTGCWHLVGADNNLNRKFPFIFNMFFLKVLGPEIMFF